jgi:hypothetical protein
MRAAVTLVVLALAGCASKQARPPPRTDLPAGIASTQVDPVRLHNQLIIFADETAGDIAGTMSNIAAASRDRIVWEQTILFKTRVIPLLYLAAREDDPREAFLDMWVLVVRLRFYLASGVERNRFGQEQHQAIEMATETERQFLALGARFYPEAVIADLKDEVESIAGRNPITEIAGVTAVHAADAAAPKEMGALGGILAIPLMPVTGVSGIKDAAGSIDSATRAFEAFTTVTQVMPEQIRWQAELLLLEIDSLDTVVKVREDLGRLSAGVESISKTAATMPQDVRRELDLALKDAEPTLDRIQAVLADARRVMEQGDAVSLNFARAAEAWDQTAQSVNEVLKTYKDLQGPDAPPPDPNAPQQPSDLDQLAAAAEKTNAAADSLRALLAELDSGKLDNVLARAGTAADASVDHTVGRLDGLVDRLTWRALIVVGAFAVAMLFYRVIVNLIVGSRGAGPSPAR